MWNVNCEMSNVTRIHGFMFSQKVHKFYGATISKSDRTRLHLRTTANTINMYLTGLKLNLCAFCAMSNSLSWWSSVNDIVCSTLSVFGLCTHNSCHDYLFSISTLIALFWSNAGHTTWHQQQQIISHRQHFNIRTAVNYLHGAKDGVTKTNLGNICSHV